MPRHFFKVMKSPYFQSEHYKNSEAGKLEVKIENCFKRMLRVFKWKKLH